MDTPEMLVKSARLTYISAFCNIGYLLHDKQFGYLQSVTCRGCPLCHGCTIRCFGNLKGRLYIYKTQRFTHTIQSRGKLIM